MKFLLVALSLLSFNVFAGNSGKILNCSSDATSTHGAALEITKLPNGGASIEVATDAGLKLYIVKSKSAAANITKGESDTLVGEAKNSINIANGEYISNAILLRITGANLRNAYLAQDGIVYKLKCVRLE